MKKMISAKSPVMVDHVVYRAPWSLPWTATELNKAIYTFAARFRTKWKIPCHKCEKPLEDCECES